MLDKDHVKVSEALYLFYVIYPNLIHNLPPFLIHNSISLTTIALTAGGIYIGSQLPDIDSNTSTISRCTRPISTIVSKFGHHGITHSLWFIALIGIIMYLLPGVILQPFYLGIFTGTIMHILEDSCSKSSVIWLFPFGHYRLWKKGYTYCRTRINTTFRYKTGGKVEAIIGQISYLLIYIEFAFYIFFTLT